MQQVDVLILGTEQDFVLKHLVDQQPPSIRVKKVLMDPSARDCITYDVYHNSLKINGDWIDPKAVFMRPDFYMNSSDHTQERIMQGQVWHAVLNSWIIANPQIRSFNKSTGFLTLVQKPLTLRLAVEAGLHIAETYYTNDVRFYDQQAKTQNYITKAVTNGGFTRPAKPYCQETVLVTSHRQALSHPTTLQRKLDLKEMRIFRVDHQLIALDLQTESLDYREKNDAQIIYQPHIPTDLIEPFMRLTDRMGLNFCAADFKYDAVLQKFALLEVNDSPMFAAFDRAADGRISKAIWDFLLK